VRVRATLKPSTATGQDSVRAIIAHERRVELAFENHRWFDLVRTGQAIPVMTAFGTIQKEKFSYLLPSSYTVTPEKTDLSHSLPRDPGKSRSHPKRGILNCRSKNRSYRQSFFLHRRIIAAGAERALH